MGRATKRPWANYKGTILSQDGQVVAECHVYDKETNKLSGAERDANAELIVSAVNSYNGSDAYPQKAFELCQILARKMYDESAGRTAVTLAKEILEEITLDNQPEV